MKRTPTILGILLAASPFAALAQTPTIGAGGIVNGASFNLDEPDKRIAPGSLVSIFGQNLASANQGADTVPLSVSIGDVKSVTVNGVNAPLLFVSTGQVNIQVPWETLSGSMPVVVTRTNGQSSNIATATVAPISPGIFTVNFGKGNSLALIFPDNAIAAPAGAIPGRLTRPAKAGDILQIYASGLGPLAGGNPADGSALTTARSTATMPVVTIGGMSAPVQFSGMPLHFVGLYQVNVQVPSGITPGNAVPLQIQMGGVTSTPQATIAVQ